MIMMAIVSMENDVEREFITNLYKKYYSAMKSTAFSILKNEDWAQEAVQEVFVDFIERADKIMEVDGKKLPAYIMAAVKYRSFDSVRKRKKEQEKSIFPDEDFDFENIEDDAPAPDEIYIKKEEAEELSFALEKLPEKDKILLEAKYILCKSDDEMAKELGIKPSSVRVAIMRAKKKACIIMKGGRADG